jgi:cysteine desulfurase/selenocysteine lyase
MQSVCNLYPEYDGLPLGAYWMERDSHGRQTETGPIGKANFPRSREVAYLDTAAEGLPPQSTQEAFARYYEAKATGTPGRRRLFAEESEVQQLAGRLLGTRGDRVALLSSASEGLNRLAASIAWQPGDEVLIDDLEFPSNVVVWLPLRDRGVVLRVAPSRDGVLCLEDFTARIGPRTRVVSVSQVSYKTGTQLPFLSELSREARRAGALFCVDATQALGRVPVGVTGVDYLVASSYKWLLGVHGLGIVYLSPELEERLTPAAVGWYSIRDLFTPERFETFSYKSGAARLLLGMPNFPAVYALREGLEYLLAVGVERIESALRPLVRKLRSGLEDRGFALLTPAGPEFASGILSFAQADAENTGAKLEREGVIVWAGDGRVRMSVHLYNDESDIDRLFGALDRVPTARVSRL